VFGDLLVGKKIGPSYVFGNIGVGILTDSLHARAQQDLLTFGAAALLPVSAKLNFAGEVHGQHNPRNNPSPGSESRGEVRLGMQLQKAGLRWDLGATAGLTHWDHKAGLVAGITREFRLWR
jgi:hypothetical protein